jgi:hypothetical protein
MNINIFPLLMTKLLIICDDKIIYHNSEFTIVRVNSELNADIHVKYENYCYTINNKKIYEKYNDIKFIDETCNDTLPYIPYYQNSIMIKVIYILHLLNYENIILFNQKYMDPIPFYNNSVLENSVSALTLLDIYMTKQFYKKVNFTLYDDDLCLPVCIPRYNDIKINITLYDFLFNNIENVQTIRKYIKLLDNPIKTIEYMLCDEYKKIYFNLIDEKFIKKYKNINQKLNVPINKQDFNTIFAMFDYDSKIYSDLLKIDIDDNIYIFLHFLSFESCKEIFNLPNNFNIPIYRKLNADLINLTDRELLIHFHKQGIYEKRHIYENLTNFDWKMYVEMNNLELNTKYEAENHYLTFGKKNDLLTTASLPNTFNYDLHILENPKLKNMKKSDVLKQYLSSNLNNIILPLDFNSINYVKVNPELNLNSKNNNSITDHFINYGVYEQRDYGQMKVKYEKIILLLCHIGDFNTFLKMEHYIENAILASNDKVHFEIVLNVVNTLLEKDKQYIMKKYSMYEIIDVENFGFDIGSFFSYLKKCKDENISFDYVIKIHTKTSDIERDNLIKPLLGSVNRIKLILDMLNVSSIGLIGSKRCMFYNYDKLAIQNQNHLTELIKKFNINISYHRMVQFIGGTIFFIKFSILKDIFFDHDFDEIISGLNNESSFDWNWYICANKNILPDLHLIKTREDALNHYNINAKKYNLSGNLFHALKYKTKSSELRDAMIEHAYERLFSYAVISKSYEQIFLPYESYIDKLKIQPVPIIFPQFHSIPENDEFWSDGFTEWTMLNKVKYNYLGTKLLTPHDDIGQYNILDESYLLKVEAMMKNHLINTVIYYHYWFNGHKVMYKPIEKIRDEGKPNVKFVLAWANETWSSRWDGQDNQILLKQDYGIMENWIIHIEYLLTFFNCDNYVVIDNKPLFYIYRPLDIPYKTFNNIMEIFTEKVISQGFSGIKLIIFYNNTTNLSLYEQYKNNKYVDGIMDFNPNYTNTKSFPKYQEIDKNSSIFTNGQYNEEQYLAYNIDIQNAIKCNNLKSGLDHYNNISQLEKQSRTFKSSIGNICSCYDYIENEPRKHNLQLYSTFMGWDNTPRRDITKVGMKPTIFLGGSPQLFEQHIKNMIFKIIKKPNDSINWLIINAWNEWNEQTMLEPSTQYGYRYLEAIKNVFIQYY